MIYKKVSVLFCIVFFHFTASTQIISTVDSLIFVAESTDDQYKKVDLYNQIAEEFMHNNPEKAISYSEKALNMSLRNNYELGIANAYFIKGVSNEERNKFDEALDSYVSSLIIYKHLNRSEDITEVNFRLGRICKTTGNYEKALEFCLNALRLTESIEDPLYVTKIYNTMGSIYKYLGDYDKSLEYYFKCAELQEKYREDGISAGIYNNIGIVYNELEKGEEALNFYRKSLEIRTGSGDSLDIASSYNNIASYYLANNNLDSGFVYLKKSLRIKEKYGSTLDLVNIYNNYAEYFYKTNKYDSAFVYIQKSLSIARKLNLALPLSYAYNDLTDIYVAQKDYKKALEVNNTYHEISDSIYNVDKSMRIAQLAMLYDAELKQIEHELADQKKKFANIITYGTLIFILTILFFLYRNLKSKFKRKELEQKNLELEKENLAKDLDTKKREMTKNIIYLTEKNELLQNLKKDLKKLKSNLKSENKPVIQSIINELTVSYNNKMWDEFEVHFMNVHKDFYSNLYKDYPNLTQNEKRLAAFLKLNMSSKEISMITKQSVHSITVARTRLRKKLNLCNSDISLASYLEQF